MDFELPEYESGLKQNLFYLSLCLLLVTGIAAGTNLLSSGEDVRIGNVEVFYECAGLDVAGFCLGLDTPNHETFNYDDYEAVEEGTSDYYRRVEAELMLQAYNICENQSLEGMDWLEEAEYDNQTGTEWYEMDEVELLGCEETFRFELDDPQP